jgi:hypothetical protein
MNKKTATEIRTEIETLRREAGLPKKALHGTSRQALSIVLDQTKREIARIGDYEATQGGTICPN